MLPRWHILFGAIFTILIWLAVPKINLLFLVLLFLATFLIDFDHYATSVIKTRKLSLFHSFYYHDEMQKTEQKEKEKGIRTRGDFHILHTIEFHILVGLLSFFWVGFFYIFLGMMFHSLIDIASLLFDDKMYRREFFFVNWLYKKLKKTNKPLGKKQESRHP